MQRRFRLRRRRDFGSVLDAGRVYAGATLVGFAVAAPAPRIEPRIGVSVSRRLRGSVRRNRARRRVREAARLHLTGKDSPLIGTGMTYDVVLIARPAALTAPFADVVREALMVGQRARRRRGA